MSATRQTTIWCDGEGCGVWDQETGNAAQVRRAGWRRARSGEEAIDLCPSCSKARAAERGRS